jgi:hydroxymethylbilane synthase
MSRRTLLMGTRGSQLALRQAGAVSALLNDNGIAVELVIIRTTGDRLQEEALPEAGGKRLFVKEIEDALLRHDVDVAVHSAKDLPASLPEGLDIAAALPREDPRDAIVLPTGSPVGELKAVLAHLDGAPVDGAPVLGTSSVRRAAQLAAVLPGATFAPIRGNVDTRLRKLDSGGFHALVLASAGMRRLGFDSRISAVVPIDVCVPAPGQGIIAVEIRADDDDARRSVGELHDAAAGASLVAERALVTALGGGCQLPLGGVALHAEGDLDMHAVVASLDGRRVVTSRARGSAADPLGLGHRVADELLSRGASAILDEVRRRSSGS